MGMWYCATCNMEKQFNEKGFPSEKGLVICKKCKAEEIRKELNKTDKKEKNNNVRQI